jgi:hypothetical protein
MMAIISEMPDIDIPFNAAAVTLYPQYHSSLLLVMVSPGLFSL